MKIPNFFLMPIGALMLGCSNNDEGIMPVALPDILPRVENAAFSEPTGIDNLYFGPPQGTTYVYLGGEVGSPPTEEIRIDRRNSTKVVMGVECIVQHDVVTVDGILLEDTDDWIAQDDSGNLWYFGELVKNYDEQGNFLDNDGSFEAGVDGALPGYWMPANPTVGMEYYQEYYLGEAEDQAEVLSLAETVTIGLGTYTDCIVTRDINPFEANVYEKKYFAPGIGLIKEEKFEDDELVELVELVKIIY